MRLCVCGAAARAPRRRRLCCAPPASLRAAHRFKERPLVGDALKHMKKRLEEVRAVQRDLQHGVLKKVVDDAHLKRRPVFSLSRFPCKPAHRPRDEQVYKCARACKLNHFCASQHAVQMKISRIFEWSSWTTS
eukprot:5797632-Pleurochrysis_carterae.AAC.1